MLIDTHCHLNSPKFSFQRNQIAKIAFDLGISKILIPSLKRDDFLSIKRIAKNIKGMVYALGIHPLYVKFSTVEDLNLLDQSINKAILDPCFVAIGEIGLDFFGYENSILENIKKQEYFYLEQLKLAGKYKLPVILHTRKSQDRLLKYIRQNQSSLSGGIVHAFNGSLQQAHHFIDQGFALGFGGMVTYNRSTCIRKYASQLKLENIVLETDAPDGIPSWLFGQNKINEPSELVKIAEVIAQLRDISFEEVSFETSFNAMRVIPRINLNSIK
ncbi:MAG: TatD family hydrolase [Bordetella sp.]|nr:MAG: TatD family hydrolase [Bordetella sp.]